MQTRTRLLVLLVIVVPVVMFAQDSISPPGVDGQSIARPAAAPPESLPTTDAGGGLAEPAPDDPVELRRNAKSFRDLADANLSNKALAEQQLRELQAKKENRQLDYFDAAWFERLQRLPNERQEWAVFAEEMAKHFDREAELREQAAAAHKEAESLTKLGQADKAKALQRQAAQLLASAEHEAAERRERDSFFQSIARFRSDLDQFEDRAMVLRNDGRFDEAARIDLQIRKQVAGNQHALVGPYGDKPIRFRYVLQHTSGATAVERLRRWGHNLEHIIDQTGNVIVVSGPRRDVYGVSSLIGEFDQPTDPYATAPRVIIIETTPDIERSQVIRRAIEALEQEGVAKQSTIERVGQPVDFHAEIHARSDLPYVKLQELIETLRNLSVKTASIRAESAEGSNRIILVCPADVTWRHVRTLQEELQRIQDFNIDVRVAANNDPVTPTGPIPSDPKIQPTSPLSNPRHTANEAADPTSPDAASPARDDEVTKVMYLQYVSATEAARIIRQVLGRRIFVAVDERTNSLVLSSRDGTALKQTEELLRTIDSPAPNNPDVPQSVTALSEIRRQCDELDQQARNLADRLRQAQSNSSATAELREELRDTVRKSFDARQKLQRAELDEFTQRLRGIQQSIEMRERIRQQIIDRRVEELLDPNLEWEPTSTARGR